MKGFFLSVFVILILAAALFTAGWLSLWSPTASYTVFLTKTSGVLDQVADGKTFIWRSEGLLPTNVTLQSFDTENKIEAFTLEGVLEKGEDYTRFLGLEKLFEYKLTAVVSYRWNPERLPHLVRTFGLTSTNTMEFLQEKKPELERALRIWLVGPASDKFTATNYQNIEPTDLVTTFKEFVTGFWREVSFDSIVLTVEKAPDTQLYSQIRDTFNATAAQLLEAQSRRALEKNQIAIRENEKLELLARYGELLEKYPGLRYLFDGDLAPEVRSILPNLLPSLTLQ